MKTQKQRMIAGEPYLMDEELKNDIYACREKIQAFNKLVKREDIQKAAKNIFGKFGENSSVTHPSAVTTAII